MSVHIHTASLDGTRSSLIRVEASFVSGFSGIHLIGNQAEVVKSGLERAKAALVACGVKIPSKKILISLLPGDFKKDGSQFDLAFAVVLYSLIAQPVLIDTDRLLFAAELSLDGALRSVKGGISFALEAMSKNLAGLVLEKQNFQEIKTLELLCADQKTLASVCFEHLSEILVWLRTGQKETIQLEVASPAEGAFVREKTFDDMRLSPSLAKTAVTCATGLHSMFLYGPPGTGKTMFASRIPSVLPKLPVKDHIDVLKIYSLTGEALTPELLSGTPPFRCPHHSASSPAMIGLPDHPGEVSLAHGGILFLDEFPEFRRDVIEALREPLENGHILVSRARSFTQWDSQILLIAALNNCPCGWFGSAKKPCQCPTGKILAYKRKLSGPILDRIDIHLNFSELKDERPIDLLFQLGKTPTYSSKDLQEHVLHAQGFSKKRNKKLGLIFNRELKAQHMEKASGLEEKVFQQLLEKYITPDISHRSLIRILRVARSLADTDLHPQIREQDIIQACRWTADACAKERGDFAFGM